MAMRPRETISDWLLLKQSLVVLTRRDDRLRAGAAAASRARDHRHVRRRRPDAARQLGASHREGRAQHPPDLRRRRVDHDLLLHRPVHRGARRRGRRPAASCSPTSWWPRPAATWRHAGYAILWASAVLSAIVDNIPFVATMIPLIKSMAPAYRRAGQDRAAVVVPVARRLSWRQRHADRRVGQSDGGRASRSATACRSAS